MFRRLLFTLALLLTCATVPVLTSCDGCTVVFLNGPGNHPPGGAYFADTQTWYTVVGGQLHLYGYSLTVDTVIWSDRSCIYNNLRDRLPLPRPV